MWRALRLKIEKVGSDKIYRILYVVIMSVIVSIVLVLILTASAEEKRPVKVGCVFNGSVSEAGWNGANYEGISAACDSAGLELAVRENIPEEEMACLSAVSSLTSEGCEVIFLVSYGYQNFADKFVSVYPDVRFCVTGSDCDNDSLIYCLGRVYEGRYLAGIAAGVTTRTDTIGYVAAMPNNEVNRGINAFTLGVRKVNPDARVKVIFTNSWDDSEKEKNAVKSLADASADIIAYHQDQEDVPEACDALGIDFIGCYEMKGEYSDHYLTSINCDWKKIYGNILRFLQTRKKLKNNIFWLGVSDGAVELTDFSENVSLRARYEVTFAVESMNAGVNVFSGEIYDSEGNLRCQEGEAISEKGLIFDMDWYVQGVEIYEDR